MVFYEFLWWYIGFYWHVWVIMDYIYILFWIVLVSLVFIYVYNDERCRTEHRKPLPVDHVDSCGAKAGQLNRSSVVRFRMGNAKRGNQHDCVPIKDKRMRSSGEIAASERE